MLRHVGGNEWAESECQRNVAVKKFRDTLKLDSIFRNRSNQGGNLRRGNWHGTPASFLFLLGIGRKLWIGTCRKLSPLMTELYEINEFLIGLNILYQYCWKNESR